MKKIVLLLAAMALSATVAFAQNDFVLTEQLFSRIAVNPAGTGNDENVNIFSLNRFQYAGAQGAPFSTLLNVHSYFDKANSGVGITFSYDGSGIAYRQFQAKAVYAYHLNFGKQNLFSFGVGLGVGSAVSVCAVGEVCKDSNSLKSARSIFSLLICSRPFFALLVVNAPLVFCELFLLTCTDYVLCHLCRQFQTTALELFFEGGILLCQFLCLVF